MDEDLKIYLREMEDRTASLIGGELRKSEDRSAALIVSEIRKSEDRSAALIVSEIRKSEDRSAALIVSEIRKSEDCSATLIVSEIRKSEDRSAALIASELGGLHTDIQNVEKRVKAQFESIDSRLKLQAGLIQSGARAMARFSEFSENSEERWVALVARVEALERKVSGENRGNGSH